MKKIFLVYLLISILRIDKVLSQDIHFSQLPMAPLNLNPALAGANYSNQLSLVYKDQWKSSDAQFTTIYAGYDQRFFENNKNGFLAGGINFFSDKAGDSQMKTNYAGITMGYHLRLDQKQLLGLCIQPSFGQKSIDFSALRWGMQYNGNGYDSNLPTGESGTMANQFSYFDIGAGMVYTYKKSEHYMTSNDHLLINAGYSVNHINRPRYTFFNSENENLFMRHTLFVNAQIGFKNSKISLLPGFYSMLQGSHTEFLLGTYCRYSLQDKSHYTGIKKEAAFSLGGFYRFGDAIAIKTMIDWAQFSFGFSYDINLSGYTTATQGRGGFELAIRFVIPNRLSQSSKYSF
jgi:type IX secretion system PorP/SprF family membrane protein